MIYAHDTTTPDGGRTVRASVYNAHSGLTVLERVFKGPLRTIRAETWGATWAQRLHDDWSLSVPSPARPVFGLHPMVWVGVIAGLMWLDAVLGAIALYHHVYG